MAKRRKGGRKKNVLHLKDQRNGVSTSAIIQLYGGLALILGITLLALGHTKGDRCKMHAIDFSSWNDPNLDGNLVKWFK